MTAAAFKSLKWADPFFYALTDPRALLKYISVKENKSFYLSFLMPFLVSMFEIITFSLLGRETKFFYYKISYGWILIIIIIFAKIIIIASLIDLIGQFLGHGGRIKDTICLLNYSIFPRALLLPMVFIFKTINFAPLFFYILFSFLLFIWSALIAVQGISEMYSISFSRALLLYIFPDIFLGLIIFFSGVLAFICGMGFIFT